MSMFSVLPIEVRLIIIGVAVAAVSGAGVYIHHEIRQGGYDAAIADVTHDNQEAVDAVNKGRAVVRACNATSGMRWSQVTRECVPRT